MDAPLPHPFLKDCKWPIHDWIRPLPKTIRDRHSPVPAERPGRDLHAGSGLPAFIFITIHQTDDAPDELLIKTHVDHFGETAILFDVRAQDWIQNLVGRER